MVIIFSIVDIENVRMSSEKVHLSPFFLQNILLVSSYSTATFKAAAAAKQQRNRLTSKRIIIIGNKLIAYSLVLHLLIDSC